MITPNWKKHNSDCQAYGEYLVCRRPIDKTEFTYIAYKKLKTGGFKMFAEYETPNDAKLRCEQLHRDSSQKLRKR